MSRCGAGNAAHLEAVAACCRVLGALFYLPPDDPAVAPILASLRERRLLGDWPFGSREDVHRWAQDFAAALSGEAGVGALAAEYQRLFVGPDALPAPPWGSVYLEEEGTLFGETTLALRRFLDAQGLVLNTGIHEPDDHFGLLLWAAAWLAEQARPSAVRTLLDRHLLPWSDRYLGQLEAAARHPFYTRLAELTRITLNGMQAEPR